MLIKNKFKIKLLILPFLTLSMSFADSSSFLTLDEAPNSLELLPPPPAINSPAFQADKAAYLEGKKLRKTARGEQAILDADLSDENIGKPFSQALGVDISAQNTPITYDLLKKLRADGGNLATKSAKEYYMRTRPFMYYHTHSCTPQDEKMLSKNGSYPSGHTTIGWATALVLTEIRPQRQKEILKRGYEFGQSRVICGAHWQSDVNAGRIMGAADVARLHADPEFINELNAAKKEINAKLESTTK